jgi:hypothetical protein
VIKRFANAPWTALFFHVILQVTACHVQADCIAKNVLLCIRCFDVSATCAYGDNQFNFVVKVLGQAGVRHAACLAFTHNHQGVCGFQKEEGGFSACETHFFGVFFVIATYAVDAASWKAFSLSQNWNRNYGSWGENKTHKYLSCK